MRPLKLKLHSFGPFKETETIDFTKFNNDSLFLLTGPTGSGKTTIFDAISYVLFDQASGENRTGKSLISDYSEETEDCYVEFEFKLKNKNIRAIRHPKRSVSNRKTDIAAKFELYIDEELRYDKQQDSTKVMEELLGLSADQFKQIVMLPQGEFRKLLLSKSSEKEAIFRNIFNTKPIEMFQIKLKNRAKELEDEIAKSKISLSKSIKSIHYEANPELDEAIEREDYKEIMTALERFVAKDKQDLSELNDSLAKITDDISRYKILVENLEKLETIQAQQQALNAEKSSIEQKENKVDLAEKAQKLKEKDDILKQTTLKISTKEKDLESYDKKYVSEQKLKEEQQLAYDNHQLKMAEIPSLEKEITKLTEEKRLWVDLDEIKGTISNYIKLIESHTEESEKLEKEMAKMNQQIISIEDKLSELPKIRESKDKYVDEQIQLSKEIDRLEAEEVTITKALAKRDELTTLNNAVKGQKEKAQNQFKETQRVINGYFSNLAVVLATDLKDTEPCPVCGSTHHPHKAEPGNEDVSKEEYENAQMALDQEQKKLLTLKTQATNIEKTIEDLLTPLAISNDEIGTAHLKLKNKLQELKGQEKTIADEIKKINDQLDHEPQWRQTINDQMKDKERIQESKHQYEAEIKSAKANLAEVKNKQKVLSDNIKSESLEKVNSEIEITSQTITLLRKEDKTIERELNELKNNISKTKTAIDHTKQSFKELNEEADQQQQSFADLQTKYQLPSPYSDFIQSEQTVLTWKQEIKDYNDAINRLEGSVTTILKNLPPKDERQSKAAYRELMDNALEHNNTISKKRDKIIGRLESNQSTLKEIETDLNQQEKTFEKANVYKEMAELAAGKLSGIDHISFERYVLGIYLDEILKAANKRFTQMTTNRYILERQTEFESKQGAKGLDLEVFDNQTGKRRSVKSLSGGEQFKASLSLAFGLSDIIQQELGGIEINTLFIDEGFGTLDQESLDQAINVLMELNQSGRLIGIISHVEELKQRIPTKIVIENQKEGSTLSIEY